MANKENCILVPNIVVYLCYHYISVYYLCLSIFNNYINVCQNRYIVILLNQKKVCISDLNLVCRCQVELVRKEMLWESEKQQIALDKMKKR